MKKIITIIGVVIIGVVLGSLVTIQNIQIVNITKDYVEISLFNHSFEYGYCFSLDK